MKYYISRYSDAEIEAHDEVSPVFGLPAWHMVDESELQEDAEHYELTTIGAEYVDSYLYDYSAGYDLCNGKMHGLASLYTMEEFWTLVTNKELAYISAYDNDEQLKYKLNIIANEALADYDTDEQAPLGYIVPDYEIPCGHFEDVGCRLADEPTIRIIEEIETKTWNIIKNVA